MQSSAGDPTDPRIDLAVRTLATRGGVRELRPHSVLCIEGEPAEAVYVVLGGELHASVGVMAGGVMGRATARDVRMGTHPTGSIVGELTALSGGHRSVTLMAGTDGATVSVIPDAEFAAFIETDPDVGALLAERARMRMDRIRVATLFAALLGPDFIDLVPTLAAHAELATVAPGHVLFEEGDPSDGVYLIVSGRLVVTRAGPEGEMVRVGEAGRGEVVGELGLLDRLPRSATVTARRQATLAFVSEEAFTAAASIQPGLAMAFARYALTRIGHAPATRKPILLAYAADPDPVCDGIADDLAAELAPQGSFERLDRARVDQLLGRAGAADAEPGTGVHVRLTELFHEVAGRADVVLLDVGTEMTSWTRSALDHAHLLVVALPAGRPVSPRIHELVRAVPSGCRVSVVHVHGADAGRPLPTAEIRRATGAEEVHQVRSGRTSDLARVARLLTGRGVGLVLGGGGARGFAHLGVLRALDEVGIAADHIAGASIGSVIGAAAAQGLAPAELVPLAERQFENLLDYTLPLVSLLKGKRISRNIDDQFGGWDLADLWTPFTCVSTNLTRSRTEVHRSGDAAVAVRASVAIPGVLPPVPSGEDLLVDGGVLNNLPVDLLAADPAIADVIAVEVAPPIGPRAKHDFGLSVSGWDALRSRVRAAKAEYPGLAAILTRSMLVGAARDRDRHVESGAVDLLLDLDLRGVGLLEFDRVREVADRGYETSLPLIEAWVAQRGTHIG